MFRISVFAAAISLFCVFFLLSSANAASSKKRTVIMRYSFAVEGGSGMARVWVPKPPDNEEQRVVKATIIESPVKDVKIYSESNWGNSLYYFEMLLGKDGFTFTVEYEVERLEVMRSSLTKAKKRLQPKEEKKYLSPSRMAVHNERVKRYSDTAVKGASKPFHKGRKIYDFVLANMVYDKTSPGWGKGDVNRACLSIGGGGKGAGNCTDFHSFFASLMQMQSVPVVFEMGFPLKPGAPDIVTGGYHCWAKFYDPQMGWVPVDISEASKDTTKKEYYFGSLDENRILFSRGRDIILNPRQSGEALNFFGPDPYIEINGVPFSSFKRTISYEDFR